MKTFKQFMEDGMGGGAMSAGPTNTVGSGAIAGTGTWGPFMRFGSRNEITLFELKKI